MNNESWFLCLVDATSEGKRFHAGKMRCHVMECERSGCDWNGTKETSTGFVEFGECYPGFWMILFLAKEEVEM